VFHQELAMSVGAPTAALIQGEGRCDEVGSVSGQPLGAIERVGGFLAAGESHLDGALGMVTALLEPHHGVDPRGVHVFHVVSSAALRCAAMRSARSVQLPPERVVLVSTNSLYKVRKAV